MKTPKAPKQRKSKKDKDENKPKRPQSSYMLWLNDTREQIKSDNPGISVTDLLKKAGELWKKVEDRSVWDAKAKEAKESYDKAMKEYSASGGGAAAAASSSSSKSKDKSEKVAKTSVKTPTKSAPKVVKPSPAKSPGDFKSKEYISTDESSSGSDSGKKKKKTKATSKKSAKKSSKNEESEDEDEDMASTPESSDVDSD